MMGMEQPEPEENAASDPGWAPSRVEFAEYVLSTGGGDHGRYESRTHARHAQAARRLWSGECPPTAAPVALTCALCGGTLESFALGVPAPDEVLCEGCADLYLEADAGPLLIDRLTIPAPSPSMWPLEPPGPRTVAFDPPLELRLTVDPGDGEGPYLVGYEDPDDPAALGVRDVNGEPGVSGGTRGDLIKRLADYWGFHYLTYVSEAAGLAPSGGLPVHPRDQQDAQERLAEFERRVQVVSPGPSSGEGSEPCVLPLDCTGAGKSLPAEPRVDGPRLPRTVTRILRRLRHPGRRTPF